MKRFGFLSKKQRPVCAAVIVAAGSSRRMQGVDKIMAQLRGQPVIVHTIRAFERSACIDEIVLVTRPDLVDALTGLIEQYGFQKVTQVVRGGDTRTQSVENGLRAVSGRTQLVAVQDGARPLVTEAVITEAVERAQRSHASAPAIAVKDTVKEVDGSGRVVQTPDRAALRAVQTPQVFDRDLLLAAWEKARQEGKAYTDDCGAMEAMGVAVYLTAGSEENIKITTPMDLILAEEILRRREQA